MAFVIISHQPSGQTSLLPELLGRKTATTVVEAANGMKLEPNHVYIDPPGGYPDDPQQRTATDGNRT
jgi:two-component system, chemotaxis family, CheB/CheR fusion protein